MARLLRFAAIAIAALVFPASALAGAFTLHPSGFGEHSYSSWKGGEGLPDSNAGTANQALYFQKMTTTATFVAGVAVIKGLEGEPMSAITGLSWWVRLDGHCGAGAPRWNIRYQPTGTTDPTMRQTLFIGCAEMVPGAIVPGPHGTQYQQRTFTGSIPDLGTITSLSIVFDEGNDVGQGYTFLDNITVNDHTWTSASDNGNGETIVQSSEPLESLLDDTLASLF